MAREQKCFAKCSFRFILWVGLVCLVMGIGVIIPMLVLIIVASVSERLFYIIMLPWLVVEVGISILAIIPLGKVQRRMLKELEDEVYKKWPNCECYPIDSGNLYMDIESSRIILVSEYTYTIQACDVMAITDMIINTHLRKGRKYTSRISLDLTIGKSVSRLYIYKYRGRGWVDLDINSERAKTYINELKQIQEGIQIMKELEESKY